MSGCGIINGDGSGRFVPKGNATRAEAAKIIYELIKTKGAVSWKSAIKRAISVILIFAALIVPATFAFASEDYTEYADKLIAFGIIDNGF